MIIINTTFALDRTVAEEFEKWLNDVYIPAAMATGLFSSSRLAQVLSNEDPRVLSIACELCCESLSEGVRWHDETASLLRDDMFSRWGDKVMFFTTYLKQLS